MKWFFIVVLLCIYGFFKEFRPLEPFLTPYLRSEKNFTDASLYSKIYPFWTYSYLCALVPIFLLTDLLRYNIILIFGALTYSGTWTLLIWGHTVRQMQWMQVIYGFAAATEVAYFAYAYAAFEPEHYKKITSYTRSVLQAGRFLSYGLGQLLVSNSLVLYLELNYIALASSIFIFTVALFLPWVSWRKNLRGMGKNEPLEQGTPLVDQNVDRNESQLEPKVGPAQELEAKTYCDFVRIYFSNLLNTFKRVYSTSFMWKWSLWCALASCGMFQVTNYIQNLWDLLQGSQSDVWNGIVEAICTFLCTIIVFFLQYVHVPWSIWGECILAAISVVGCVLLIIMSSTTSIILSYILYIVYRILYEVMFTVATYNIAKNLSTETFGLVFGFNTFVALAFQTILTIIVADEHGLALEIKTQFLVYGGYYGAMALLFFVMGIWTIVSHCRQRTKRDSDQVS